MADLFRLEAPELPRAPVLICAVDSWIDAGLASSRARSELLNTANASLVGRFDSETLVDHQARRPVLHLLDGVNMSLEWPTIDLHLGEDPDGRRFLLLVGAEPDRLWPTLAAKVVELAREAGVRRVLTLGAYPAPVPHTRAPKTVATASTQALADLIGFVPGQLAVPAGFNSAVERVCAEIGLEACGLWAQVPHYVANLPYPAATVALLEAITKLADLRFELTELRRGNRDREPDRHLDRRQPRTRGHGRPVGEAVRPAHSGHIHRAHRRRAGRRAGTVPPQPRRLSVRGPRGIPPSPATSDHPRFRLGRSCQDRVTTAGTVSIEGT